MSRTLFWRFFVTRMCRDRPILKLSCGLKNERLNVSRLCPLTSADPEGGTGGPDSSPPGKSHVIWVSIGNMQLDPPPPPPLENVGAPAEP